MPYTAKGEGIHPRMRAIAQYMKTRDLRKVDRDVFIVTHDGYDHHNENGVGANFDDANDALHNFIDEMHRQDLWDKTLIIMGSDFGRSIPSNANGGTDHAVRFVFYLACMYLFSSPTISPDNLFCTFAVGRKLFYDGRQCEGRKNPWDLPEVSIEQKRPMDYEWSYDPNDRMGSSLEWSRTMDGRSW